MEVFGIYNGKTDVYGIIGNPIGHSFSPVLQNTILRRFNKNGIYVPFKVEGGDLKKSVEGMYAIGIKGLNVTVPHKRAVMNFLCGIDNTANKIGAVNTLKYTENGYEGYNTDILGLKKSFEINCIDVSGKRAMVIGAGGAANSAVMLFAEMGAAKIVIANRTIEKAEALKKQAEMFYSTDIEVISINDINNCEKPNIILNATSVGMGEGNNQSPISDNSLFVGVECAFDVIYTPWETKFLKDAKACGCTAVNGFDMLIYQGIASYEIWHDTKVSNFEAKEIRNMLAEYFNNGSGR